MCLVAQAACVGKRVGLRNSTVQPLLPHRVGAIGDHPR